MEAPKRVPTLFFSRGKGRGHAVPDDAIARQLRSCNPAIDVTFASYDMGALTLKELGWDVVDLQLPEDNPLWETVIRVGQVLEAHQPRFVISHEEVAPLSLARAHRIPSVLF